MLRSTIGFDYLPEMFSAAHDSGVGGYPPYNIEKVGPDSYAIEMAVAGLDRDDIEITQTEGRLLVRGQRKDAEARIYLYHGLADRMFSKAFDLADHVEVVGANLVNGLLTISLKRVLPEASRPRTVAIECADAVKSAVKLAA
jgi:molecular chaperone IbpA